MQIDRTLKALSLLLSYPTGELQQAMPEIGGVLAADKAWSARSSEGSGQTTHGGASGDGIPRRTEPS